MTRKDYVALAASLARQLPEFPRGIREEIHAGYCGAVADVLAADNARFNREMFLLACKVASEQS